MFGPICVSIAEADPVRAAVALQGLPCAELRLDAFEQLPENLHDLVRIPSQCLLTCRPGAWGTTEQALRLQKAILCRPAMLDVDMEAAYGLRMQMLAEAQASGIGVVLSRHWYEGTPELEELCRIVEQMLTQNVEVVKIASRCRRAQDLVNLLSLYSVFPAQRQRMVVLGMGEQAALARLVILQLGAPFTFAAPDDGAKTASGQLPYTRVKQILAELGLA